MNFDCGAVEPATLVSVGKARSLNEGSRETALSVEATPPEKLSGGEKATAESLKKRGTAIVSRLWAFAMAAIQR